MVTKVFTNGRMIASQTLRLDPSIFTGGTPTI
jgi:hypothetical protein